MALVGCSGDDGSTSSTTDVAPVTSDATAAATTLPTPITVPVSGDVTVPIDSIAPLPPGVADADATDPFCRSLARITASTSLLVVAVGFGALDDDGLWFLETLSTPLVLDAVDEAEANLPVEEDRDVLSSTVLDPHRERARVVMDALQASGATRRDLADMRDAWLDVLRSDDPIDPGIDVADLRPDLDALVRDAARSASAASVSLVDDASLASVGSMPGVERYLAAQCPAVLGLLAGDAV